MSRRIRTIPSVLAAFIIVSGLSARPGAAQLDGRGVEQSGAGVGQAGTVDLTVILVTDELELRPVPKWSFRIAPADTPEIGHLVTTSFQGKADISLPPGDYVLESVKELDYKGTTYSWQLEFSLSAGETVSLELSNDNARVSEASLGSAVVDLSEGELYRRARPAVMKVLSERGHGTGFLVSPLGLILTNHHVAADSEYLAVLLEGRRKHTVQLVEADELNDIAVLQINPLLIREIDPLPLADDSLEVPPVDIGQRVLAIGSPYATDTILTAGLVSKIQEGAIYSDVAINPGNSGGPLFNMRGEVIGINTFALGGIHDPTPGVQGIVRIHLAKRLLRTASEKVTGLTPPPVRPLPVESDFRFPPDKLRETAMRRTLRYQDYHLEAGKFDVQILTPVSLASLEVAEEKAAAQFREKRTRRKKKKVKPYEAGKDFYEWRRYRGDYRAVVTLQAVPEITLTAGSAFAIAMLGYGAPEKYKFKADFDRMELRRGQTVVEPLHPRRFPNVVSVSEGRVMMEDIAYYGSYEYPPEAFAPGAAITVKIWRQGSPTPIAKVLPPDKQARIWRDFEPYFSALEATAASGDEPAESARVEVTDTTQGRDDGESGPSGAPEAAPGALAITGTRAYIFVNGALRGRGALTVSGIAAGTHTVEVRRTPSGESCWQGEVSVLPAETTTVDLTGVCR